MGRAAGVAAGTRPTVPANRPRRPARSSPLRPPLAWLAEEGQRQRAAGAVGDHGLQDDAAGRCRMGRSVGLPHLGQDGHLLAERRARDVGQLAALGVPARVVAQQVADGVQAELRLQRLGRLAADDLAASGVSTGSPLTPPRSGAGRAAGRPCSTCDLDERPAPAPRARSSASASAVRRVRAEHQRHQLAAAVQHPVQQLPATRRRSAPITFTSPSTRPSTSPARHGPAMVSAVPGGHQHLGEPAAPRPPRPSR